MQSIKKVFALIAFVGVAAAQGQSPEPPVNDTRIQVNTLVREDIFAGYLADDMDRFARGEKNVQRLLELRPNDKSTLLAWAGSAAVFKAVKAHENQQPAEFQREYKKALDLFAQSAAASPGNAALFAIMGGTYVVFADRLPKEVRAEAWTRAYDSYQQLWKQQAPVVDKLPLHIKGELLGGLAQSAQRTGHNAELAQYLDRIQTVLADTAYANVAKKWKDNPKTAASVSITCLSCHEAGRLSARLSSLSGN
jgi:hypothetical protein